MTWLPGRPWEPDEDDGEDEALDTAHPPWPEVVETDNPVVAVLWAADGAPLIELRERRTVPFGYQP